MTDETRGSRSDILRAVADLVEQHDLPIDGIRFYTQSAEIGVDGPAEIDAWAKALGADVEVKDRMPLAMHYRVGVPMCGWRVEVSAITLTPVYSEVTKEVQAGLEDKVITRAAEQTAIEADVVEPIPAIEVPYECEGCGKRSRIAAHEPGCPVAAAFDEAFGDDESREALVQVLAASVELTCAQCEATSENCSAHISSCPIYQAKKLAERVTS